MVINEWKGNRIGDEGARKINEALKTNSSLTTLWLNGEECEK